MVVVINLKFSQLKIEFYVKKLEFLFHVVFPFFSQEKKNEGRKGKNIAISLNAQFSQRKNNNNFFFSFIFSL